MRFFSVFVSLSALVLLSGCGTTEEKKKDESEIYKVTGVKALAWKYINNPEVTVDLTCKDGPFEYNISSIDYLNTCGSTDTIKLVRLDKSIGEILVGGFSFSVEKILGKETSNSLIFVQRFADRAVVGCTGALPMHYDTEAYLRNDQDLTRGAFCLGDKFDSTKMRIEFTDTTFSAVRITDSEGVTTDIALTAVKAEYENPRASSVLELSNVKVMDVKVSDEVATLCNGKVPGTLYKSEFSNNPVFCGGDSLGNSYLRELPFRETVSPRTVYFGAVKADYKGVYDQKTAVVHSFFVEKLEDRVLVTCSAANEVYFDSKNTYFIVADDLLNYEYLCTNKNYENGPKIKFGSADFKTLSIEGVTVSLKEITWEKAQL